MIKEIYCKLPTDLDYQLKVESDDEYTNLLQLIKVILGTKPGEVLGSPMFGVDLEKYLFTMNFNKEELLTAIKTELSAELYYDPNKFDVNIDVLFGHNADDPYDYALIDIIINLVKCMGILVNQQD